MLFDLLLFFGLATLVAVASWFLIRQKEHMPEKTYRADGKEQEVVKEPTAAQPYEPTSYFRALSRSRAQLSSSLRGLFSNGFNEEIREDLEAILLSSDVGVDTTDWVLENLKSVQSMRMFRIQMGF